MVNKGDDSKVISGAGSGIAGAEGTPKHKLARPSPTAPGTRPCTIKGKKGFQPKPIEERHRIAAAKIAAGAPIMPTMLEAGYSVDTASRGVDALRHATPVLRALQEGLRDVALAPSHTDTQDGNIVTNVLRENIMLRRDRALGSLSALARIRGLMQPDTQVGIIITSLPDDAGAAQWADAPGSPDPE